MAVNISNSYDVVLNALLNSKEGAEELLKQSSWQTLAATGAITIFLSGWIRKQSLSARLPPGPKGYPVLGNALDLLSDDPWVMFTKWNDQYGPVVGINVAGHSAIILGTLKAAADLMDRRANIYSDRPRNIVVHELMNGKLAFASGSADEFWKRMRKAAQEVLNKDAVRAYHPHQDTEAMLLVYQLMHQPEQYADHVQRAQASLMQTVLYGLPPIKDSLDPVMLYLNGFIERLVRGIVPGAYWVEYFTWMEYLPRWMCKWRRDAEDCFQRDNEFFIKTLRETKARVDAGDDTPSVAAKLIEEQKNSDLTDQEAAWLLATLYIAGTEASAGQQLWFMLAMCIFPDIQEKAFSELQRVVGMDRMPSLEDYDNLVYFQACVKETMRWRPLAPIGVPHRLREDDVYEGHFIPKDTIIIPNTWRINHDPELWGKDADKFRPERHLNEQGDALVPSPADTKDEGHTTYGFGSRICVGRNVSNKSLCIQMAAMVWAFKFTMGKGEDGKEFVPDTINNGVPGVAYRPKDFPCVMTPRTPETKTIIEDGLKQRGVL